MSLYHEHLGPKILAKIKLYVLIRAKLLFLFAMRYPVIGRCIWHSLFENVYLTWFFHDLKNMSFQVAFLGKSNNTQVFFFSLSCTPKMWLLRILLQLGYQFRSTYKTQMRFFPLMKVVFQVHFLVHFLMHFLVHFLVHCLAHFFGFILVHFLGHFLLLFLTHFLEHFLVHFSLQFLVHFSAQFLVHLLSGALSGALWYKNILFWSLVTA